MRTAVVGHVEWVDFARVERLPVSGEIVQASECWAEAAGGGGVASVQLARLAGSCVLYTALGLEELGDRALAQLASLGVRVEARRHAEPQRRAFTYVEAGGERTITIMGEKHVPRGGDDLPWDLLAETDGVYFVSGDAAAARAARRARTLVATARVLPVLAEAGVELDALVRSGSDRSERYSSGDLHPRPRLAVTTSGVAGGSWTSVDGDAGTYAAEPPPGPVEDSYGAGDSFAAGLTYALARGESRDDALRFAARAASAALTRRGAHGRG
ncbi:MAG TPA: PfkB family carbohydrate kinase [Gaiellaceae bacterium]|nr:PfkB family carbohydrate kinase [Gaiellaceae bacterium]